MVFQQNCFLLRVGNLHQASYKYKGIYLQNLAAGGKNEKERRKEGKSAIKKPFFQVIKATHAQTPAQSFWIREKKYFRWLGGGMEMIKLHNSSVINNAICDLPS